MTKASHQDIPIENCWLATPQFNLKFITYKNIYGI